MQQSDLSALADQRRPRGPLEEWRNWYDLALGRPSSLTIVCVHGGLSSFYDALNKRGCAVDGARHPGEPLISEQKFTRAHEKQNS